MLFVRRVAQALPVLGLPHHVAVHDEEPFDAGGKELTDQAVARGREVRTPPLDHDEPGLEVLGVGVEGLGQAEERLRGDERIGVHPYYYVGHLLPYSSPGAALSWASTRWRDRLSSD